MIWLWGHMAAVRFGPTQMMACAFAWAIGAQESAHQGTVLLFPGRTEYIEKYGLTAVSFATRGYAVASVDWRGQGLADRLIDDPLKGHVEKFSDHQRDVRAFLQAVEDLNLPKPLLFDRTLNGGLHRVTRVNERAQCKGGCVLCADVGD
jgi:pimeloyl-ACP methyl ester carboxylesterase